MEMKADRQIRRTVPRSEGDQEEFEAYWQEQNKVYWNLKEKLEDFWMNETWFRHKVNLNDDELRLLLNFLTTNEFKVLKEKLKDYLDNELDYNHMVDYLDDDELKLLLNFLKEKLKKNKVVTNAMSNIDMVQKILGPETITLSEILATIPDNKQTS
jgi:hypothetical protein